MPWAILLRVASRNVSRHWRHSVGTLLSIALGFVSLGLFEGYLHDLFERQSVTMSQRNLMGDVLIEHREAASMEAREEPLRYSLDEAAQREVATYLDANATEIRAKVRLLDVNGLASAGRAGIAFGAIAHDVDEAATLRGAYAWNTIAGVPLHLSKREAALLSRGLGTILRCEPTSTEPAMDERGEPIPKERPFQCHRPRIQLTAMTEAGRINATNLEVGGLFSAVIKELDNNFMLVPLAVGQRLLDTRKITMVSVLLSPDVDARRWVERFNTTMQAKGATITAARLIDHRYGALQRQSEQILAVYRSFVVIIVVTIAGMSVLMTMMKATSERTREIGTLRAVGYRRRHILTLFAVEASLLGLLATGIGAVVTLLCTVLVNALGITYHGGLLTESIPLVVAVVPATYAFASAFLPSVAFFASLVPAWRASRIGIADALSES